MSAEQPNLHVRITEALAHSDSPDPYRIADVIRSSLTASEEIGLVREALVSRVRTAISRERSNPQAFSEALPRKGSRIVWPSDERLVSVIGDGSFREASVRLGVSKDALKRYCEGRGIVDDMERIDARHRANLANKLGSIVASFADETRAEGVRIGLEQASVERVCVAGEWMFLADCTAAHLRTLSNEYVDRAAANMERGSYYLALAQQVEAGGHATVRAMCEADLVPA